MRTNIVLNDELVEEALRYSKSRTRRGLVEEALRTCVEVRSAIGSRPSADPLAATRSGPSSPGQRSAVREWQKAPARRLPPAMTSRSTVAIAALGTSVVAFFLGVLLAPSLRPAPEEAPAGSPRGPAALDREKEPRARYPSPATEAPRVTPRSPLPEPYPTRIDRASLDLTGDGSPEVVELYADVEPDSRGRLMWDDGQRWRLVAHTGDPGEGYLLFDDFVQIGRLSFWAIETVEPPNALVLEIATGAGVRVWRVRYDPARDAFVEEASVSASGNVIHRTPAELE